MKAISVSRLTLEYPDFVWFGFHAELIGINFDTKQVITIDDGTCVSDMGWLVHGYNLKAIPTDWRTRIYKYLVEGDPECLVIEKFMESWNYDLV